jgi:acyl-CoA synthetase (AMP-forming)/AMP-acid ligase II
MTLDTISDLLGESGLGPYTAEDSRRYYESGYWQDRVLYDVLKSGAAEHPDRVFVTDGENVVTYGQLRDDTVRLAAGLQSIGVGKGDRVAVQMPNWAEFATITLAISRLGAILVPIMPIFRAEEVGYILGHSGAVVVIGPDSFRGFDYRSMFQELRDGAPALQQVVVARAIDPSALGDAIDLRSLYLEGDVDDLDAALGATASADDGCLIVYTSGTTSRPKGCYHTFNTIHSNAFAMSRRLRITPEDVFFNPSPVAHSTGLVTGLVMPLLNGASTHFQAEWNPDEGLQRIERFGCTVTFTATTFLATAMQAYDEKRHNVSSMRYWVCAGAPIPGPVVQAARAMFANCAILSLYGRSENFATSMCGPDDAPERSVTSDGRVLDGAELAVVDADGNEVPRGVEGDLAYRGPSLMLGYYDDPDETALLYTPEQFSRSGDLGTMDDDGFIRVSGRLKDIIIRGGLNISSREVEDLLSGHPAVRAIAVVGMPDPRVGEKSCAFVVLTDGADLTLRDVSSYLDEKKVAIQKHPERLEIVDSLPMTAVGKVRKNVLRDLIAEKLRVEALPA